MAYEKEREIAIATTTLAAQLTEHIRYQSTTSTLEKPDDSPVTIADFGAQALICQGLSAIFPDDPIIGEEDATLLQESPDALTKVTENVQRFLPQASDDQVIDWINRGNGQISQRYWTLDPIDGTKGFIRGDQYAVALALIEEGRVKVGVLVCPALPFDPQNPQENQGVIFVAVENQGTEMIDLDHNKSCFIHVNRVKEWHELLRIESLETRHSDRQQTQVFDHLLGITKPPEKMDSLAKYGVVARGEADIYLRIPLPHFITWKENIWDHAAGIILVEEAGGKVTDLNGKPLDFSCGIKMVNNYGIVASNGWSHRKLLETLHTVNRER